MNSILLALIKKILPNFAAAVVIVLTTATTGFAAYKMSQAPIQSPVVALGTKTVAAAINGATDADRTNGTVSIGSIPQGVSAANQRSATIARQGDEENNDQERRNGVQQIQVSGRQAVSNSDEQGDSGGDD
ncbi:hypothetical protein D4R52_02790 [bacterium]|nr:MAG: hypothetical protein D4R52_02790 [bacterium]